VQGYFPNSAWGESYTAFIQYTLFPDRSNGKPLTGSLDLIGGVLGAKGLHSGYKGYKDAIFNENIDKLAKDTRATISSIEDWQVESGNLPGLHPGSDYRVGRIDIPEDISLIYGKKGSSILDIYNPLSNHGDVRLDRLIASGRVTGNAINLEETVRLNDIRKNTAQSLNLLSNNQGIVNGRKGNASFADLWINNKNLSNSPDFRLKGFSGKDDINGFVRYTPPSNRVLKTKSVNGMERAQDPEAKILEQILLNTNKYDKIHVKLSTERSLCRSCSDVVASFLELRPNATIEISGSVIP
jgi:hypothetical protein